MPIQLIPVNAPFSLALPNGQVSKGRQDRRMFKPRRVASAWQESIAARVRPRSENRWRVSRAQPWLASLLQFLMISEQLKSVVSLPEAPGRLAPPVFAPPVFSGTGNDTGRAPPPDFPVAPLLRQAALSGSADNTAAQRLGSELRTLEQKLLAGASSDFSENITRTAARQIRQAPAPNRRLRQAQHPHLAAVPAGAPDAAAGAIVSAAVAEPTRPATALPHDVTKLLDRLAPSLLPVYLKAQGYADVAEHGKCMQGPEVLNALHRRLEPVRTFIGDPASLGRLDADALEKLMRHVAQEIDFYGARDGERSAPEFQRESLIRLVSPWAAGCAPETQAGDAGAHDVRSNQTIAHIKQAEQSRLQESGLTADAAKWAAGMLWADAEPTLARADTPDDLRYASLEWSDLQIGIDTARMAGLDHWAMSYTELVALAQTGDMTARQVPDAAAGLLAPQVRAALVFAGMSVAPGDRDAEARITQAMIALSAARTARWEAAQRMLEALQPLHAPMPTRDRIAAKILSEHGISADTSYPTKAQLKRRNYRGVRGVALDLYMNGARSLEGRALPELNQRFDASFDQYKKNYQSGLEALYQQAVEALPEQDRLFWQKGQAQTLEPSVWALRYPLSATHPTPELKPFTTIVAITHEGRTRHYIASTSGENGRLIRFFAEDLPRSADNPVDLAMLDRTLTHHVDELFTPGDGIKASQHRQWHLAAKGTPGPAASGVAEYFIETIEKLRPQAYAPTAKERGKEGLQVFLMSLIPFHNCVTEYQAGNIEKALFSCALDIASLVPVVGAAGKTAAALGRLALVFNIPALKQLAGAAARKSLLQALGQVAGVEAKSAARGGKTLAWEAAKAVDPGLQLLRGAAKGLRALASNLYRETRLNKLADAVGSAWRQKPFHFDAGTGFWKVRPDAVTVRDGGRFADIDGRELEVIDIGKDKHIPVLRSDTDGDTRFFLVDPRSGLPYGPQWTPTLGGLEQLRDYRVRLKGRVPDTDERGIIHFRHRDYILMDGRNYPVRYDEDWKTWRIYKENNQNGYPIPVRHDAGRGQWKVHSDIGLRGGTPPEPLSFDDLPDEIITEITRYLPDQDIDRITQVNRRLETLLSPESQRIRLTAAALTVTRLPEFQALLGRPGDGVAVIRGLREPLQEGPLTALISRIGELPGGMTILPGAQRAEAFDLIREALTALAPQYRTRPLTALADQIHHLAGEQRMTEYRHIFGEMLRLDPRYRAQPLAALAGQNSWLPELQQRTDAFNDVVRETLLLTPPLRAAPLAALSTQIRFRPGAEQLTLYDEVFDLVNTVPASHRAGPLAALAMQIEHLPPADRQTAFNRVIGEIPAIPLHQREVAYAAVSEQMAQLGPDEWPAGFEAMIRVTALLPDEARSVRLVALLPQLRDLPEPRQEAAFTSILEQALTLPRQHHATPLTELIDELEWLPDEALPVAFRRLCDAADGLDADQRADLVTQFAWRIDRLPDEGQLAAYDRVFGMAVGLPAQHREIPLAAAIDQLHWMPEPQRMGRFRRAQRETVVTPQQYRARPYIALAEQFEFLPEGRLDIYIQLAQGGVMLVAERRAELLTVLAHRLGFVMPPRNRLEAVIQLLRQTYLLAAAERGAVLSSIAHRIHLLDSAASRERIFNDVLHAIDRLPLPHRAEPLRELLDQLGGLSPERHANAEAAVQAALAKAGAGT